MKKLLFISLFIFNIHSILSQSSATPSERVVFPSPQAGNLGKYGGFNINHSSGSPSVNLPIYTAQEGKITIPISLNYTYTGFKPTESPTWVGLGWNLSIGGQISRQVKGQRDEMPGTGYLARASLIKTFVDGVNPDYTAFDATNVYNGLNDNAPDMFTFQFLNYSGKFLFDEAGNIKIVSDQKIKITKNITNITTPSLGTTISDWTIIVEDGTQYKFNAYEISNGNSSDNVSDITAWYLTEIISTRGDKVTFTYSGIGSSFRYQAGRQERVAISKDGSAQNSSYTYTNHRNSTRENYLTKVSGSNWEINFNTADVTQVLSGNMGTSTFKKLTSLDVKNTVSSTIIKSFIFNVDGSNLLTSFNEDGLPAHTFTYNGNLPVGVDGYTTQLDYWGYYNAQPNTSLIPGINSSDLEPRIDYTSLGSLQKITYPTQGYTTFEYEANDYSYVQNSLTTKSSTEIIDKNYWWYINGTTNLNGSNEPIVITEANTRVDIRLVSDGQSNAVCQGQTAWQTIYLAAGTYQADYFFNTYFHNCYLNFTGGNYTNISVNVKAFNVKLLNNAVAGGIRVKSLKDFSSNSSQPVERKFTYIDNNSSVETKSSGVISQEPTFDINVSSLVDIARVKASSPFNPFSVAPVYYKNVAEFSGNTRIENTFTSHFDKLDNRGKWAFTTYWSQVTGQRFSSQVFNFEMGEFGKYDFFRSLPKNIKTYDYRNPNSPILKQEKTFTYNDFNAADNFNIAAMHHDFMMVIYSNTNMASGPPFQTTNLYYTKGYYIVGGWPRKLSETTTDYNAAGTSSVSTVTNFEYANTNHLQMTKQSMVRSDGKTIETTYRYPHDFITSPAGYLTSMITANMLNIPIEQTTKLNGVVVDGNLTTFKSYTGNPNLATLWLPYKKFKYNGFDNSIGGGFTPYNGQSDDPSTNTSFREVAKFSYDKRGNITNIILNKSDNISYVWSYNGQYPIAEVLNATEANVLAGLNNATNFDVINSNTSSATVESTLTTLRGASGLSSALVTGYTYLPLVGISTKIMPNALKTSYNYDTNERLSNILDHNNNIVNLYEYTIGTSSFIREVKPRTAVTNTNNCSTSSCFITNNYFDGLGRPLQTVAWNANWNNTKDIVSNAVEYDPFGRAYKTYIPFSNQGSGAFVNPSTITFTDSRSFTEITKYDNSGADRPLEVFGPGAAWNTTTIKKPTKFEYSVVSGIRKYEVATAGVNINGTYSTNLYKNITTSEQGNNIIEYKDNLGRVLQKEVELDASTTAITAYVYDDFGQLAYVIQPEGYQLSTNFVDGDLKFVFAYKYDKRGRVIRKHIPGGGWTEIVYDKRDRPVMTQNAMQTGLTTKTWSYTKYDGLNREIESGEIANSSNRATLQGVFDLISDTTPNDFPSTVAPLTTNQRVLKTYDIQTLTAEAGGYETEYNSNINTYAYKGLLTNIRTRNAANNAFYENRMYYTNKGRLMQTQNFHHLNAAATVTHFGYNFVGDLTLKKATHKGPANLDEIITNTYDHQSRLTKTEHTIAGTNTVLAEYVYDDLGRLAQKKVNPGSVQFACGSAPINSAGTGSYTTGSTWTGGVVPTSSQYPIIQGGHIVNIPNGQTGNAGKIDNNGTLRLTPNSTLTVSGTVTQSSTININNLQTVDYSYHIRGWLTGVNPTLADGDLFSYNLEYESQSLFDGNIGKVTWKSPKSATVCDMIQHSYSYTYDKASRLKSATFNTPNSTENFSLTDMVYDRNGNITRLRRNGKVGTNYPEVDNLTLDYTNTGNRLNWVKDDAVSNASIGEFKPVNNAQGTQGSYTYYNDGSLKSDANEKIQEITYDTYLKQPSLITLTDSRKIRYSYDGAGKVLKTEYLNSSNTVTEYWDYDNGLIFKNNAFYQLSTAEGRALFISNAWQHEFQYKDHLGNTRVSFTREAGVLKVKDIADFDPWGVLLETNGAGLNPENRWKLQGKEKESTYGLNRIMFGARTYNPTIGRFDGVDPLADHPQQLRFSPYVYGNNNPIRFIDPDGRLPGDLYDQKGNQVGTDNVNDGKNYVVTDKQTVKDLKKSGGVVASAGAVNSAVLLPSNAALQEASNVIDRTEANGGFKEENSIVMKSGQVIQGSTGPMPTIANGEQVANATLPNLPAGSTTANVEATIHSHPTQVQIDNNMAYPQSATLPSSTDRNTFKNYGTNIIVGRLGQSSVSQNPNGSYAVSHQPLGAVIYNSNTQPQIQLTQKAIQKILKTN